jgi:hypothetical protein
MMRFAAAIILLAAVAGCARPGIRADAPGTYVLHLRGAADTLWVRADGGYAHLHAREGAARVLSRGTWTFDGSGTDGGVVFSGVPFRSPAPTPHDPPATLQRTATGAVVLVVDGDGQRRYHRISRRQLGSGGEEVRPGETPRRNRHAPGR